MSVKSSPKKLVPLDRAFVYFSYENCELLMAQLQPLAHYCSLPSRTPTDRDFHSTLTGFAAWNSAKHLPKMNWFCCLILIRRLASVVHFLTPGKGRRYSVILLFVDCLYL